MSHVLSTYARFPLTLVRGEGSRVWDDAGKSYLDFCTGIAVCSLGHCPPRLVQAIREQAGTLLHVSNLYRIPQQEELARVIVEDHVRIPGKVFFANSGAESNDGLIKTARKFGHARPQADGSPRYEVLSFTKSFHGRTLGGINATGQDKVKEGFDPMLPGFRHLPFNDLAALQAAIAPETAAILLEPVQGEGGVNVATPEFLRGIAALCKKHDLLLLLDEVQAGFGRCGQPMAWRAIAPELEPDGISWAKGMGGGFPIGAFWLSDRAVDSAGTPLSSLMGPGTHGTTYGGNPLACAASLAVLAEIAEKNLEAEVLRQESRIRTTIASWKLPAITEVRGIGLLLGIGLDTTKFAVPAGKLPAAFVCGKLLEAGLLVPPAGPETIRLLPPLNVTDNEVDEALAIFHRVVSELGEEDAVGSGSGG
ncbi:MAG: acetylornithine/succinylornithine family transaminase [Verrucomicrobia bacterium]|nr:MAG: acetylornithine/succinylornithine family transaminase [Verrucomicrobiota bacterium]TAE88050.1 MAG: acetylornithine/succinylornithine family transaminase [Verrucomicrobiota bacterium]TAF22896.1 MAG: acetylornithine/succinylornithine family transaminase [Verrucomicrobiota bacterium]TAF41829.1 MAG: acetylornithine/succinylornithine family transaminase [Verrucomicrobiota bacterium]